MTTEAQVNALFDRLARKIAQLQDHSGELSGAVNRLESEKIALQETVQKQAEKIRELQKKINSQKEPFTKPTKNGNLVKDNQAGTADNTELKQKLDEYIREIEQLIAHLSTLS
jgi:predicted RNase H-like nuclease (RuvC/YqgF family)